MSRDKNTKNAQLDQKLSDGKKKNANNVKPKGPNPKLNKLNIGNGVVYISFSLLMFCFGCIGYTKP